jgi:hypothetical protein
MSKGQDPRLNKAMHDSIHVLLPLTKVSTITSFCLATRIRRRHVPRDKVLQNQYRPRGK